MIGVAAILLMVAAFLIYRRRQKRKVEAARKEEAHFVDLDGDEDQGSNGAAHRAGRRGVSQTYHVSPFTYQATSPHSPEQATSEVLEMNHDSTQNLIYPNDASPRPGSTNTAFSYSDGSWNPRYPPAASSNQLMPSPLPLSPNQQRSETDYLSSVHSQASQHNASRSTHSGAYVLRTRNDSTATNPNGEAPPLPRKRPLYGDGPDTAELSASSRRLLQHADAGPAEAHPSTEVEELPPTYGQWTTRQDEAQQPEQQTVTQQGAPALTSEVTRAEARPSPDGLW